jgi:hypothetical protein
MVEEEEAVDSVAWSSVDVGKPVMDTLVGTGEVVLYCEDDAVVTD